MPEATPAEQPRTRIRNVFAKEGLLSKVDWYDFEDDSAAVDGGLGAGAKAAEENGAKAAGTVGEDHLLITQAKASKPCPRCGWLCEDTEIECFRCAFRFNVNQTFVSDLHKLGAEVGGRQIRFESPFTSARLASATMSNVDAFLLRLSAETLRCSSGFEELLSVAQLNIDQYDYQMETVKRVLQDMRGTAILADEVGLGKALSVDCDVLTTAGWKRMGDIRVGDDVIGADGRGTRVTGVYPQGELDIFRVTFSDDSSVECSDDHLWAVNDSVRRWRKDPYQVQPLSEIRRRLTKKNGQRRNFVPVVEPVHFQPQETALPLHPYLLGALLGDGGLSQRHVVFTTADPEMVGRLSALLPKGVLLRPSGRYDYHITCGVIGGRNAVIEALRALGLLGHRAETKFIPEQYLFAAPEQRLAVLQGLLDTDGHVRPKDNNIEYATSSEQLAKDTQFVVRSLGGIARIRSRIPHYTYKGERKAGRRSYRMSIQLPAGVWPFALMRKAAAYHPRRKYPPTRNIVAVEHVGKKRAQCIKVAAADGLFVVKDLVVTHNTIEAGIILKELDARSLIDNILIITPAGLVREPWESTMRERFALDLTVIGEEADWDKIGPGPKRIVISIDLAWRPNHLARLLQTEWDMLVIDEAHYLRNRGSKRFKGLNRLRKRYCLMLTATPVQNHIVELYGLVSLLKPGHLGTIRKFRSQYFRQTANGPEVNNPAALQKLLYQVMVRNRRASVGLKLPKRVAGVVHLRATKEEMDLYNDISNFVRTSVRHSKAEQKSLRLSLITLQRELASSAAAVTRTLEKMSRDDKLPTDERTRLADFAARGRALKVETKVQAALEIVKAAGGQFVIFVEYVPSGERIKEALTKAGVVAMHFSDLDSKQKAAAIADFRSGKTQVFIAGKSGSEGHNLQFCHQLINFDLPWNPMIIEQRVGRLHRIGQAHEVYVFNLAVDGTVEERVLDLLARKLRVFSLVVGELDMVLGQLDAPKTFQELLHDAWLEAGNNTEAMKQIESLGDKLVDARKKYDKVKGANSWLDNVLAQVTAAHKPRAAGAA